jgi:hypothetical protein
LAGAARALRAAGSGVRVTAEVKLAAARSKGGLLERPYLGNGGLKPFLRLLKYLISRRFSCGLKAQTGDFVLLILGCIWRFRTPLTYRLLLFLFRTRDFSPAQTISPR